MILSGDIDSGSSVETALGEDLSFHVRNGKIFIRDSTDILAKVLVADVLASNGVAHVINSK